jgi:hypothetical protein
LVFGFGFVGLGFGPQPQSPNPQSPIPNPQSPIPILKLIKLIYFYFKIKYINNKKLKKINFISSLKNGKK